MTQSRHEPVGEVPDPHVPVRSEAGARTRVGMFGRIRDRVPGPGPLPTIVVAALVAGPALLVRVWALDGLGANSDEAVYAGQAASLARDPALLPFFPVFRAHPLLFQSLLSLEYRIGGGAIVRGRPLSGAVGLAPGWVTHAIGGPVYGAGGGGLPARPLRLMAHP